MVEHALKQRRHKPMFLVDLAVPRDIEEQVTELEDAYLYTVDDLQSIVAQNLNNRQQAAEQAGVMIADGASDFMQWLQLQDKAEWLREYRQRCEEIKQELVLRAQKQLAAGQDSDKVLAELATKLSNRLMHSPTRTIRQLLQSDQPDANELVKLLIDL